MGWMVGTNPNCKSIKQLTEEKKEGPKYEVAWTGMEGWFPVEHWADLYQTWAGLGQISEEDVSCMAMMQYVEEQDSNGKS
jgi:hypothetical protein